MEKGKKQKVREMFNSIAGTYDSLNHFLSFGIDRYWRKRATDMLKANKPSKILDVATGTGDFAIKLHNTLGAKITGVDISENMINEGNKKITSKGLCEYINLQIGDSENLNYSDNYYDAVTVAFGVRNFENLDLGLKEMHRVLRKGGKVVVLEFSKPKWFPFKQLYNFYTFKLLPMLGGLFSKNKKAYEYLPDSVRKFPDGEDFLSIMCKAGFTICMQKRLSFGIVTIYTGEK